jgi:hypothetical protein
VLISGTRGAEVTGFNIGIDGGGSGPAVQLSAAEGPSSVVNIENSNLAHFAVGLQVDAHSIDDAVTVLGTTFDGVTGAGISVAPGSGGSVTASIGDYFGGCGPRAPAHSYDGGGVLVDDPSRVVSFLRNHCAPSTATATAPPSVPTPAAAASAPSGGDGQPWQAIGSALVTGGVALLLVGCAVGVLYAMRRGRNVH